MIEMADDNNEKIIKNATRNDARAGDRIAWTSTRVRAGVIITHVREGISDHRDKDGDWCAEDGLWLTSGEGEGTTLTIRRPVKRSPPPPEYDGAVIVHLEREHADPYHDPRPWQDCTRKNIREGDLVAARSVDILFVGVAHYQDERGDWFTAEHNRLTDDANWDYRRIPAPTPEKEITMTKTTTPAVSSEPLARTLLGVPEGHGAPHHDGDKIRPGDFVLQVDESGFIRAGIAHHQNEDGRWYTQNGLCITWPVERADRPDALTIWPAPTPPAEEVELPGEFGAVITDVEADFGETTRLDRMVWTGRHWTYRDYSTVPEFLAAFTLPDGTRARRDGEREDGRPRFVKVREEEK